MRSVQQKALMTSTSIVLGIFEIQLFQLNPDLAGTPPGGKTHRMVNVEN